MRANLRQLLVVPIGPAIFMTYFGAIYFLSSFGCAAGLGTRGAFAISALLMVAALTALAATIVRSAGQVSAGGDVGNKFLADVTLGSAILALIGAIWLAAATFTHSMC
jgi:hypothetical protein